MATVEFPVADWARHSLKEKLRLLLPGEQFDLSYDLPIEEKRIEAAKKTVEKLREKLNEDAMHRNVKEEQERNIRALQKANNIVYSDQESDEGSDHGFGAFPSQPEDPVEKYKRFIEALPECPLNLGFHVIVMTNDADKCCFCPCGPKLENWRKQFSTGGGTCRRRERCTPNGFIDHLEKTLEDGCNYHWIVYNYLMFLYDDYWDKGLMHKAFYKVNQTKYKAAEAAQTRKQERIKNQLEDQLAKERLGRKEAEEKNRRLEEAMKSSPMFIQDLKERFDKRNKVLEKLGVARQPRETLVFTKKMKTQYTKLYGDSVELWGYRLSASRHSNPDNRIEISVAPNFEMYTEFKAWNKNWLADSTDATCLFCEIHEENAGKFLQPWNVKFKAATHVKKRFRAEIEAIDKGGPTREWLSEVWKQLGHQFVDHDEEQEQKAKHKGKELFTANGNFLVPQADSHIDDTGDIRSYYRAVGRILLYCVGQKIPIAAHVFPDLYKLYLLRDISPQDEEYPISDLVMHTFELLPYSGHILNGSAEHESIESVLEQFLDLFGDGEVDTTLVDEHAKISSKEIQKRFRQVIYDQFIQDRSIALTSLREGLTLNGFLEPSSCFGTMPLVALNYLLFCHQDIEPEDVISALAPVYGCPDDDPDVSWLECQQSVLREIDGSDNKKKTNEGVLVDLLKDASSTFLMDFIWFSTGYKYMPRSNFKIVVEFNYEEMQHDSLPVAHTCEMLLKFPGQAYDSNREVLEQKLKLSFESVRRSRFDMN